MNEKTTLLPHTPNYPLHYLSAFSLLTINSIMHCPVIKTSDIKFSSKSLLPVFSLSGLLTSALQAT